MSKKAEKLLRAKLKPLADQLANYGKMGKDGKPLLSSQSLLGSQVLENAELCNMAISNRLQIKPNGRYLHQNAYVPVDHLAGLVKAYKAAGDMGIERYLAQVTKDLTAWAKYIDSLPKTNLPEEAASL